MKKLLQYIKESLLFESGNAIKNVSPIPAKIAPEIYSKIIAEIKSHLEYKNAQLAALGSLGKKKIDQTHGDIDIAYVSDTLDEMKQMIETVFVPLIGKEVSEINYHTTATEMSIGWKFDTDKIAQIDFMNVNDLEWAKFRYDSPDFTKDESQFKGGVRCVLLRHIISEIPVKDNKITYFDDGTEKEKYKYTFNDKGVFKQYITWAKKNGQKSTAKRPTKIKELEEFITMNPKEIMHFVFGDKAKESDFKSAEALWRAFHDKSKFPYDEKVIKTIENRFAEEELSNMNMTLDEFKKIAERKNG